MRSCLYSCEVMHHRLFPAEHQFSYKVFMFYLDIDEDLSHLKLLSKNKFNWFSFFDKDHHDIREFLKTKNIECKRITVLTNARTLGYVFNPISFYFCFDGEDQPVCAIAEVSNTHKERKLYLLDSSLKLRIRKHFYVSPFSELDTEFEFIFKLPSEFMQMRVDDYKDCKRILLTSLMGTRRRLNDMNLLLYGLRFPLITVKIIFLIYWQALKLRMKGLHFWRKKENMHLQKDFIKV
ncbi:MAG: DUF1365 domain-containing protein [Bacteroidota bacterium]